MKKKKLSLTILLIATGTTFVFGQQVGIGTNQPDKSSMLELKSNTQGFLPPRMTEEERDLITSPAEGLIIYNTTEKCLNYKNASKWVSMCDAEDNANSLTSSAFGDTVNGNVTFIYNDSSVTCRS